MLVVHCHGEEWAQSLDQRRMQELQFSAHFNNLLSTLLRCNGFTGIQKALEDQTGSRPPDSDQDLFLVQVWLQEMLWSFFLVQPLSWTSPVVVQNPLCVARHSPIEKWFVVVE